VSATRARRRVLLICFFRRTLVTAVFSVVISNLFVANPEAVLPILLEIPFAIAIGQYIYRTRSAALIPSLIGVVLLYASILLGQELPISLAGIAAEDGLFTERNIWVILLFVYTFIAARIPVWVLLQPRRSEEHTSELQ